MLILKLGFFANAVLPAHGPCARYVKFRVAHGPGMPGTFSPPPRTSDPDMHHCTCVTHVLWCMPGSLTSGFLWSRWRGECFRHSRCMRNSQFYVSCKRLMVSVVTLLPLGNLVIFTMLQKQSLKVCVNRLHEYIMNWFKTPTKRTDIVRYILCRLFRRSHATTHQAIRN